MHPRVDASPMPRVPTAVPALAAALVAITAGAGCLGEVPPMRADGEHPPNEPESLESGPCLEHGGGEPSGNAPLLEPFVGEPADVAARLADALQDPLVSREPDADRSYDGDFLWHTESGGEVRYDAEYGPAYALHWFRDVDGGTERDAREFLDSTLAGMGVPEGATMGPINTNNAEHPNLVFWQNFRGELVEGTGRSLGFGIARMMTLMPYRDLSGVDVRVEADDAVAIASARMRCELDRQGFTVGDGYAEKNVTAVRFAVAPQDSLAHSVLIEYHDPAPGHCSLVYAVDVDVETGAVLGWGRPPCD